MGTIAKPFFLASSLLDYPLLALAMFMLVFVAITVRTLREKPARVEAAARLPLEDTARKGRDHD